MRVDFFPHELPSLIKTHEDQAKRWILTKKQKREHQQTADGMRQRLLGAFPELSEKPFEEWEDYLLKRERNMQFPAWKERMRGGESFGRGF